MMYDFFPLSSIVFPDKIRGNSRFSDSENTDEIVPENKIVWFNVAVFFLLHLGALYGFYLCISGHARLYTLFWVYVVAYASSISVTGGAHRLWAHRSYKANLPLRIFWATLMTMTFQNSIYVWARDHRLHHKFSETDADPHNAKRGFYIPLVILGTFILPALVPWYCWNETFMVSFYTVSLFRYVGAVNLTWCINSAAHLYGKKPYDKDIGPTENGPMMYLGMGEGFHNYHHTFPWDYKAAEFGDDSRNATTILIDFFARIGWATELKTASAELIRKRALRTGDGSWTGTLTDLKRNFPADYKERKDDVWGWGDKAMSVEEQNEICKNIL